MARLVFRHPSDPPKKALTAKLQRKNKLVKTLLIVQTLIIVGGILWILKMK